MIRRYMYLGKRLFQLDVMPIKLNDNFAIAINVNYLLHQIILKCFHLTWKMLLVVCYNFCFCYVTDKPNTKVPAFYIIWVTNFIINNTKSLENNKREKKKVRQKWKSNWECEFTQCHFQSWMYVEKSNVFSMYRSVTS